MPHKPLILTRAMRKDLLAKGFTITRQRQSARQESPFPGREEWVAAFRSEPEELPQGFACGYVPEPSVYYFEEEEPDHPDKPAP